MDPMEPARQAGVPQAQIDEAVAAGLDLAGVFGIFSKVKAIVEKLKGGGNLLGVISDVADLIGSLKGASGGPQTLPK